MSSAVQAAIVEMEAERDRIDSAIVALKQYAGGGNGAAAPAASGSLKCDQCDKVAKTAGGLAVHKARAHG